MKGIEQKVTAFAARQTKNQGFVRNC